MCGWRKSYTTRRREARSRRILAPSDPGGMQLRASRGAPRALPCSAADARAAFDGSPAAPNTAPPHPASHAQLRAFSPTATANPPTPLVTCSFRKASYAALLSNACHKLSPRLVSSRTGPSSARSAPGLCLRAGGTPSASSCPCCIRTAGAPSRDSAVWEPGLLARKRSGAGGCFVTICISPQFLSFLRWIHTKPTAASEQPRSCPHHIPGPPPGFGQAVHLPDQEKSSD